MNKTSTLPSEEGCRYASTPRLQSLGESDIEPGAKKQLMQLPTRCWSTSCNQDGGPSETQPRREETRHALLELLRDHLETSRMLHVVDNDLERTATASKESVCTQCRTFSKLPSNFLTESMMSRIDNELGILNLPCRVLLYDQRCASRRDALALVQSAPDHWASPRPEINTYWIRSGHVMTASKAQVKNCCKSRSCGDQ